MIFMQRLTFLIFIWMLVLSPGNAEQRAKKYEITHITKSSDGTVQIRISDIAAIPDAPVVELSRALENDQKTQRFRVSWGATVLGGTYSGTVLYDRLKNTVKVYGTEASSRSRVHTLYSKVTDGMLHKLAEKIEDAGGGNLSGRFDGLKQLGATSREIK